MALVFLSLLVVQTWTHYLIPQTLLSLPEVSMTVIPASWGCAEGMWSGICVPISIMPGIVFYASSVWVSTVSSNCSQWMDCLLRYSWSKGPVTEEQVAAHVLLPASACSFPSCPQSLPFNWPRWSESELLSPLTRWLWVRSHGCFTGTTAWKKQRGKWYHGVRDGTKQRPPPGLGPEQRLGLW